MNSTSRSEKPKLHPRRDRVPCKSKPFAAVHPHAAPVDIWLCGGENDGSVDCQSSVCRTGRNGPISSGIEYSFEPTYRMWTFPARNSGRIFQRKNFSGVAFFRDGHQIFFRLLSPTYRGSHKTFVQGWQKTRCV